MINRLWNDRRGGSAWILASTVAMVPFLGMVSLGTEVGSWYAIRRNAQNAADAAAIAGATALVVNDPTGAVTAGQAFATSNGFATGGGCGSMATTGQNVCITPSGTGAVGSTVTAVVKQYLKPIFTQWFVPKDSSGNPKLVTIQATAVATIGQKPGYCMLGLTSLDMSGNFSFSGGCGMSSNGTFAPPPPGHNPFLGSPYNWSVTAAGACTGNAQKCNLSGEVTSYTYNTGTPVAVPPALKNLMNGVVPAQPTPPKGGITYSTSNPTPSTTWQTNGLQVPSGGMNLSPGLYLFPGLQVNGPLSATGPVNIIIGSGGLSGTGSNNNIDLTAGTGGGLSDMNGVLIFDLEGMGAPTTPNVMWTGQFTSNFKGAIYFPYAHLTFRGGSNLTGCMIVVAKVLDFGGDSSTDMSGCSPSVLANDTVPANVVILTN
jgi:Flp pilus assembly protein TadG